MSLAIKYAARSRRMNLANRLDSLARKKAELEAGEESDNELEQADWPVRQSKISHLRRNGHRTHTTSRQTDEVEEFEEEEEMVDDGMDNEMEEESQTSNKPGQF